MCFKNYFLSFILYVLFCDLLSAQQIEQVESNLSKEEIDKNSNIDKVKRAEIVNFINNYLKDSLLLAEIKEFEKAGCLFKKIEIKYIQLSVSEDESSIIEEKLKEKNGPDDLFNKTEYVKAYQAYEKLYDDFSRRYPNLRESTGNPTIDVEREKFKKIEYDFFKKWAVALEQESNAAYLNKDFKKSIELSDNAISRMSDAKRRIDSGELNEAKENELKRKSKEAIKQTDFKKEISYDTIEPENKNNAYKLDQYMSNAKTFIKSKQYVNARDMLEKILVIDPYNYEAMRMLKTLYRELMQIGQLRKDAEDVDKMAEVKWGLNEPILPKDITRESESVERVTSRDSKLFEKLENLIIDKVEFEDATVSSVIAYLKRESQRVDPENIGISIILRLNPAMTNNLSRISMVLNDIPIGEVIKYICQATGLKYRVEERAVILGDESINEMQRKTFPVRAALINSIAPELKIKEETGGASKGGVKEFDYDVKSTFEEKNESAGSSKRLTSETLKKYFSDRGIPFPEGSEIAYDMRTGKLFVTNTPDNLRRMDNLIRELDIVTPLVLIETKFIEISQGDLEELGFDWIYSKSPYYTMTDVNGNNSTYNSNWAVNYFNQGQTNEQHGNDSILSHAQSDPADPSSSMGKLINDLQFTPQINGREFGDLHFFLYALDQSTTANLLSSPKVIATSGSPALIRMVREEYFPDSWTSPQANIVGNAFSYTPAYPEFGSARDIGIRLSVTPTVNPNNYTITLELRPEVTDFTGWTVYRYVMLLGNLGTTQADIKMAEISRRDVTTNVVIYDGETVILGGMLREGYGSQDGSVDDKVPVLGDLPLVGRLFRSKYKHDSKTNLLIFVTARLVSPDGVPVRKNIPNGIFDFNR